MDVVWSRLFFLFGAYNGGNVCWFCNVPSVGGTRYQGELARKVPSGHGTCVYATGAMYEGGWVQGREHGWGMLSDKNDVVLYVCVAPFVGSSLLLPLCLLTWSWGET